VIAAPAAGTDFSRSFFGTYRGVPRRFDFEDEGWELFPVVRKNSKGMRLCAGPGRSNGYRVGRTSGLGALTRVGRSKPRNEGTQHAAAAGSGEEATPRPEPARAALSPYFGT
jgi:hypothetical protein